VDVSAPSEPGARAAPPTQPGALRIVRRAAWPSPLGVIMLVFGILALIYGLLCFILPEFFATFTWSSDMPSMGELMAGYTTWYAIDCAGIVIAACVAVAVGIGLMGRRAWALPLGLAWAVFKIIVVACDAVLTMLMGIDQFRSMAESDPSIPLAVVMGVPIGSAAVVALWGWVLPVFLLIWLSRRPIRAEIASWRAPTRERLP
jgi:hypothetical protein